MVKRCVPKYDEDMLESCDGTHVDEGKPCRKCTDELWPNKRGPNPCCKGSKPPKREDYPNLTDDQFGRLVDLWYEFRDQYCPVYIDPPKPPKPDPKPPKPDPKPDPKPPTVIVTPDRPTNFGEGGTMSRYMLPETIGGDASMEELERQRIERERLYPDKSSGPFGIGNWSL